MNEWMNEWMNEYSFQMIAAVISKWLLTKPPTSHYHYDDVIMTMLASQITSLTVVYSIVYSGVNQRKHQSSASLAFVREIHRGPVNFPHKWPVTRKMFPFDDVIMTLAADDRIHGHTYASPSLSELNHCTCRNATRVYDKMYRQFLVVNAMNSVEKSKVGGTSLRWELFIYFSTFLVLFKWQPLNARSYLSCCLR